MCTTPYRHPQNYSKECCQVWARHADLDFVEKDAGHVDLEIRLPIMTKSTHVFKIVLIRNAHCQDGSLVVTWTASPWTVEGAPLPMLIFLTR